MVLFLDFRIPRSNNAIELCVVVSSEGPLLYNPLQDLAFPFEGP